MKMKFRAFFLILSLSIALLPVIPVMGADPVSVDDIARQLVCQCGCNSVLNNCTHVDCSSREGMTTLIKQKLDQGQSPDQIIQSFVAQYGEKVLSSPPKRGFNLTAWILPFAAILIGAGVIYLAVKKWVKQGEQSHSEKVTGSQELNEKYQQRLEKELQEFGEKGFR